MVRVVAQMAVARGLTQLAPHHPFGFHPEGEGV